MEWPEMPPARLPEGGDTDEFRLGHILDRARMAADFTQDRSRCDLDTDNMLAFALCKVVADAGEATRHVSEAFRNAHPDVPWGALMQAQDDLIAALLDFDRDLVWKMATERLPEVAATLEKIPVSGEGG